MKTKLHRIDGASLKRIEELASSLDYRTPDWVPYTVAIAGTETSALDEAMVETQHFSGHLRECSRFEYVMDGQIEDENGKMHNLEDLLDDAAERLDQAHQEWLEVQCRKPAPVTLCKGGQAETKIEAESIQIADLWHIAEWVDGEAISRSKPELTKQAEQIRDVWHLAHDLKRHAAEEVVGRRDLLNDLELEDLKMILTHYSEDDPDMSETVDNLWNTIKGAKA